MVSKRQRLARQKYLEVHGDSVQTLDGDAHRTKNAGDSKKRKRKNGESKNGGDLKASKKPRPKTLRKHPLRVPGSKPGEGCFICGASDHIAKACPSKDRWDSKKICLLCRERGHTMKHCYNNQENHETKYCYNCGETGHRLSECPEPIQNGGTAFAECFLCKERGHLSKNCPTNTHGIYPKLLRKDEGEIGMQTKPKRPRAVVLCPTRELSEQVFHVAKSISHRARFRSTMISGGCPMKPQENALNNPLEIVVGTPGRLLQHVTEGNIFYGDIKYVVLDEADTMFDRGFGPDLRKFLNPLRNRAAKTGDQGFQSVLVTATITKAVQKLLDEEFQGIVHIRTSTLHKKIASAHHDFVKISGSENKLESLLQVLEPSLAKGNRVMVFCNTLDSSRAVDHFLNDNQLLTVNYHGEVPAEERVENLNKFKSDDGDCPTLVCTDLAARGLDLAVDHVIMFDFPRTPIDYLHRTGRTARMGAKGKVTSLVTKKDINLASQIEEALRKNESLEELTTNKETYEAMKQKPIQKKGKENAKPKERSSAKGFKSQRTGRPLVSKLGSKGMANSVPKKYKRISTAQKVKMVKVSSTGSKEKKTLDPKRLGGKPKVQRTGQTSVVNSTRKQTDGQKRVKDRAKVWKSEQALTSRLSVVGFKGRQTSGEKKGKGAVNIKS